VQFVEVAARIIREEGLSKATTRRIAQEAGAPLASIHYCFANKSELFEAVADAMAEEALRRPGEAIERGGGIRKAVQSILESTAEWTSMNKTAQMGEFEFYISGLRGDAGDKLGRQNVYHGWIRRVSDLLATARADSDPQVDLPDLARAILALLDGFSLQDRLLGEDRIVANARVATQLLTTAIDNGVYHPDASYLRSAAPRCDPVP
jgi:AcrR family transcriptional regulator